MDKVGSARDVLMIAIMITVFGLGFFIIHFVMTTAVTQLTANEQINSSQPTVTALEGVTSKVLPRLDYLILVLFVGFILALMITGWFVGGYAIFAFIYMIIVILTVIFSAVLSNMWEAVVNSSQFGVTIAAFPITNNLMTYLPFYMGVVGFIGLIVMFAKPGSAGEG